MNRLVLIDGNAILHRAYHALPPLTNSKGQMINAVYGFITMLLRVVNELKPSHLAVTFDRPAPTFRKKLFKEYQAQRPKMEEDLSGQIETVHQVVREMGIPIYELDGYEADDIIGTLAVNASGQKIQNPKSKVQKKSKIQNPKKEETETIIVTGDRDILQLVNDHVKVYMPVKGLTESKLFGEKEVEEKFGIQPSQIVDYKALIGDASDNYPGVSGIGPKTAAELLVRFNTLEHLYEHLNEIEKDSIRTKLQQGKESAFLSKRLATIVKDAPVDFQMSEAKLQDFDRESVHLLFDELDFRSLIPRLGGKNIKHKTYNIEKEKKEEKNSSQQTSLF